jgi:hypothetical protein
MMLAPALANSGTDCLANQRADGQVRNIVIVHDVKVHNIGTGTDDIGDFLTEFGEVGGKDTGCDSELFGHDIEF